MIENFFEAVSRPFTTRVDDGVLGWGLLITMWVFLLFIVSLIVAGVLSAINSWFRPKKYGFGEIVEMHFEAAHYSTTYVYNAATKSSMPMTTWHPNAWKLIIEVENEDDYLYVTDEQYIRHKLGEMIPVTYTTGRLWSSISIKSAQV